MAVYFHEKRKVGNIALGVEIRIRQIKRKRELEIFYMRLAINGGLE